MGEKFYAVEDVRFAFTDNWLATKYQETNYLLVSAFDISIDSLSEETRNEFAETGCSSEPEELGATHGLSIGDKIEV